MREIKFRYTFQKDGAWHHMEFNFTKHMEWTVSESLKRAGVEISDVKKRQFTGITDNSGEEIFEGDVVHYFQESGIPKTGAVRWDNNNCIWRCFWSETEGYSLTNFKSNILQVIGNVHENPDLIM